MNPTPHPERETSRGGRAVSLDAAAVSGVVFAVLFVIATSLMRSSAPAWDASTTELTAAFSNEDLQWRVLLGFTLTPFVAAAFLWFVAVLRRRIPPQDQFVSTVFITGSTTWIALYLIAVSLVGGPFYIEAAHPGFGIDADMIQTLRSVSYALVFVVGIRVQVLIILSATSVARTHGAFPQWLIWFGYLVAAVQVLNLTLFEPLIYTFPIWVLAVSVTMARRQRSIVTPT